MKTCKFCGKNVDKLVDSHIIPEAFFRYTKSMSDKAGWSDFMLLITNAKGQHPRRRLRIGWYDQNLVCSECEKKFQLYDEYAINLLLQRENEQRPLIKDGQTIAWSIEGFDYKKLKLFFISLLWRAAASEHPAFKRIPMDDDIIKTKELIIADIPGKEYEFSFMLARFGDPYGKGFMLDPHPESKNDAFGDILSYRFYLGAGYIVYIKVDKRPFPPQSIDLAASEGKPLYIIRRTDFPVSKEWESFQVVYSQADKAMRELKTKHRNNT